MPNFKTDNEARDWYAQRGLTRISTAAEIIAVAPLLEEISKDSHHRGWYLKMIDGIPGFELKPGLSPQ